MFNQICGFGAKKQRTTKASVPKVEFVQPNDIVHFQQRLKEAKVNGADNFEFVGNGASVPWDYDGIQFTNSSWIPINNSRSRDLLNGRKEFSTPIKETAAKWTVSATPPNPNSNENRSEDYKLYAPGRAWTEPRPQKQGRVDRRRIISPSGLAIANMSRPFPVSMQHSKTPNRSSSAGQSHLQAQEKRRTVSLSPNILASDRISNSGQKYLQTQQDIRRIFSVSPNVKAKQAFPNSGQRNFQVQQNNERAMSLSPNPQGERPTNGQGRFPENYMRGLSQTPNPGRARMSSNQKSHRRAASYGHNLQVSPTTQPVRQSPLQNQEMKKFSVGSNRFPSSANIGGTGLPAELEALDAELGAVPRTPELMRKLKLSELLITPIVTMKGTAYDNERWFERDFDSQRNFHSSCTDFIQIVMLTDAQETAKKLKEFLSSELIEPRYVPTEHVFRKRQLNHFHTFWNVMHQLPFYMKNWDENTKSKLIWFYEVGVKDTLPCPFCQKHYIQWLKDKPVSSHVGSMKNLNQWLFKLHDEVNRTSKKPKFEWKGYERRWGPRKNMIKAVPGFHEVKQDDVVVNLQTPGFTMQRDIYTSPVTNDNFQMYDAVGQQGQAVVYDPRRTMGNSARGYNCH